MALVVWALLAARGAGAPDDASDGSRQTSTRARRWARATKPAFTPKALAGEGACPRVYVYDEKETRMWRSGATRRRFRAISEEEAFGAVCDEGAIEGERDTNQFDMPKIVLYRLFRAAEDARCRRASTPEDADLFLVPMWPFVVGMGNSKNTTLSRVHDENGYHQVCAQPANLKIAASLPYLNEHTAHRHVFLVGKGHLAPADRCDAWWRDPRGLLRRAMRFAYSARFKGIPGNYHHHRYYGPRQFDDDDRAREALAPVDDADAGDYPNLVSVPYPSAIHASRASLAAGPPPWAVTNKRHRAVLAIYVGTPHGGERDSYSAARPRMAAECAAAPDADCVVRDPYDHTGVHKGTKHFCGLSRDAFPATFCLEPGGDSPYRKGFYDALTAGCIPVTWGKYFSHASPWFVPPGSVVVLNETAYIDAEFDLVAALKAIPAETVHRMQHAIADGALRLQYALDDVAGDAVDTLLTGALDSARRRDAKWGRGAAGAPPLV